MLSNDDNHNADAIVHIAGVVRFSFPCEGGFKQKFDSPEQQLQSLFADARMERRFTYFEKLCLHTLRHQTDAQFSLGVVIGEDMPAQYRDRLFDITNDIPQIKIITFPVITHREAMQRAFGKLFDPKIPFHFGFRRDDDDAVAVNFVETLRNLTPQLLGVSEGKFPIAAAFPKGFSIFENEIGRTVIPAKMIAPPSAGISVLAAAGWDENVYLFPHNRITTSLMTLSSPAKFMYLRMIHDSNDADHPFPKHPIDLTMQRLNTILRKQFALTLAEIDAL